MKVLAVVPARGGSQGILKKNIRDLGGRPLLYYQVANGLRSKADMTVVSTDSLEIASIVEHLCPVIIRPSEISGDKSKTEETLLHALNAYPTDIVVTLQPTNPLTKVEHINACIDLVEQGYDSTGCFVKDYGFYLDNLDEILNRPMRQDKKPRLRETGCCWATKVSFLKKTGNRFGGKYGIVPVSKEEAIEIDDEADWRMAESLVRREYFKSRVVPECSFGEDFWGVVTDPDGLVRDLGREREKKLAWHSHILRYVNALSGKVLDVGCGLGHILSGFHNGFEKYGTDISSYAREKASQYGTILEDTSSFEDNTFDVVTLINVIEHLQHPVEVIREIWRVLKPGGKFIVETADFESAIAHRFGGNYRMLCDKTHVQLISLLGLHRMLLENMFEVEKIEYPYFDTEYFTKENLMRVSDITKVSPPFPGNIVTLYCYKK